MEMTAFLQSDLDQDFNDLRSPGPYIYIVSKETATPDKDSSIPLTYHDPSDLRSCNQRKTP